MKNARLSAWAKFLFLPFLALPLVLSGCEDPGSVGSSFTRNDGEVSVDTIQVQGLESVQLDSYSGQLSYIFPGLIEDPLFGDVSVTSLLRPQIPSSSSSDSMEDDATMKLRLIIDKELTYGDSTATADYEIWPMDQVWRGRAWKLSDEPTLQEADPVQTFSVGEEDSLDIELSGEWVDQYREFFNSDEANKDSLYRADFPGIALAPAGTGKLLPIDAGNSRFVIENEEDTLEYGFRDHANSLERENEQEEPAGTMKLHNTLEEVLTFDMDLTEEGLGALNISRVELVFYEDTETLSSTINQVSGSAQRPPLNGSRLLLAEPEKLPTAIDPGNPVGESPEYDPSDGSFRMDITNLVNENILDGVPPELQFYLRLQSNDGTVRSSLVHTEEGPEEKRPILIVTAVKTEDSPN